MLNNKIFNIIYENKFSPILLEERKNSFVKEFIFSFCKSLNCKNSEPYCNNCFNCKKIDSNTYYDLHYINFHNNFEGKEEINKIINNFKFSSLESAGNKFLIIEGIELVNKSVANLMLRSIEEPSKNTYYIFTTRNKNMVLETIKSRCYYFSLQGDRQKTKEILKINGIDLNFFPFFESAFFNVDEMIEFYKNNSFNKIQEIAKTIIEHKSIFSELKKDLVKFKMLTNIEIEKLLYFVIDKIDNKKECYELIKNSKMNINKTLIFNQIINLINNK